MLDYARLAADRWIERAIKAKVNFGKHVVRVEQPIPSRDGIKMA
jgi:hypothetical protein